MRIKSEKPVIKKKVAALKQAAAAVVDYPQESEVIQSSEYSLRISAPESVAGVEICINHGSWEPCRSAVGFWWYDWSGYKSGEYRVTARISSGKKNQKIENLTPRHFQVNKAEN